MILDVTEKREVTEAEALEWKRLYEEEGLSIEQIGLDVDRNPSTVRKYLHMVDTKMRPPTGRVKFYRNKLTDGVKGKSESKIRTTAQYRNKQGHRRRGRY